MTGYRAITYEDLPEIRRAIARVKMEQFKAADVLPHLPEYLRKELDLRELGRAMISRGLVEKVGYDRGACVVRRPGGQKGGQKSMKNQGEIAQIGASAPPVLGMTGA